MCGIIGYTGNRPALPIVMEGLAKLEYRGYDSAGVAWLFQDKIHIARATGKLLELEKKIERLPTIFSTCAMGHTRWATHGAPLEKNAHPHYSEDQSLAIVHNGIIENYQQLKSQLQEKGYTFHSDTDTEVLVNLIAECRKSEPDLLKAFANALKKAKGAYAVCLMAADAPGQIFAARMSAPLILGIGAAEIFIASDIPAFLNYTRKVVFLEDGEIVKATPDGYQIYNLSALEKIRRDSHIIEWNMNDAQKDGYRHFMLKEIFEQPRVVRDGIRGRKAENGEVIIAELENRPIPKRLHIIACGTSWHAGLWASELFESWAGIPVHCYIASEYRYKKNFLLQEGDLAIFISQSGETADTLAALRLTKEHKTPTLALCNVLGSSIAREADVAIFTQAGPEISVASTKAMCSQMVAQALMAMYWGKKNGTITGEKQQKLLNDFLTLPGFLDDHLPEMRKRAKELARKYSIAHNFFYLGRGQGFPLALEGALKLKELAYIHAEGYAAGEMKHGPIALIDPAFPTLAIALNNSLYEKVKSNIAEIKARGGKVIAIANPGNDLCQTTSNNSQCVDDLWIVPELPEDISGFAILPLLQLFSYEISDYLGKDVDQPRNLAKSVTVE